jgi:peptidoglycan/LPS O-acetylase OafA/YrhL
MWTLAYELCFYFLLPFTLLPVLVQSRSFRYVSIVIGATAFLVVVAFIPNIYMFAPFIIGMALYFLLPMFAKGISSRSARSALLLIGIGSAIFFSVTGNPESPFAMEKVFAMSLIVLGLVLSENFFQRNAPSFGPLLALSASSYSLYLWHWPVLWFTGMYTFGFMNARTTDEIISLYSIALPTLVLVTFLSWYLIERNARMKNVLRLLGS